MSKELNLADPKNVMQLLSDPIEITRFIAGALSKDLSQHTLVVGRVLSSAIKMNLLQQLGQEIKQCIAEGKIKDNFQETSKEQTSFVELLKFIDDEIPDEDRFNAMKSIFLTSVSNDVNETDKILAHEFLKICKQLSSGELVVLKATFDIKNAGIENMPREASAWLSLVAKQIGHNMSSLVELYEKKLVDLTLLSGRAYSDKSGVIEKDYRFTDTGLKFCEFIIKYPKNKLP